MAKTLEFFFDYASPYSYLACDAGGSCRAAYRSGASLAPLSTGRRLQGNGERATHQRRPARALYWPRTSQDWAQLPGPASARLPESFPINSLKANRLGLVAAEQGRVVPFSHAAFRAAFVEGRDLNDPEVLAELARWGGPGSGQGAGAHREPGDQGRSAPQHGRGGRARGAFGAPTFFVGDSMFFGNDRLMFVERALRQA